MARRGHKKSRLGCSECKQRHKKCDETRPLCVNCKTAGITCSYVEDASPARLAQTPVVSGTDSPATTIELDFNTTPFGSSVAPPIKAFDVNMDHLELLHHFQFELYKSFMMSEDLSMKYVNASVKHGLKHPFLMYQVLALSSLHLAIFRPEQSTFYRQQSVQLQAVAVQRFQDISQHINTDNCVAVFLFSSSIGLQAFCETFTFRGHDFSTVLDKLTSSIRLLRGITVVMEGYWETLRLSDVSDITHAGVYHSDSQVTYDECQPLRELFEVSDLSAKSIEIYSNAVEDLQRVFNAERDAENNGQSMSYVFTWVVKTEGPYIDLLQARRPEALILLAYYAVLLHRRRKIWAIRDAGSFLVHSISNYLGSHWSHWLKWPLSALTDEVSPWNPTPSIGHTPAET